MKTLKFKSKSTMEDLKLLYRTCVIHADLGSDFGIFCAGIAMGMTSIAPKFQAPGCYAKIDIKTIPSAINTMIIEDAFEDVKRDLTSAEMDQVSNKELSKKIKLIAEETRKNRDKRLSGNKSE